MVAPQGEEGPGSLASVLALPLTRFQGPLAFPGGSVVKNPPVKQEMWVLSLDQKDPVEEMSTHSSILAWEISWTEEPGRLQSMGSQESDTI